MGTSKESSIERDNNLNLTAEGEREETDNEPLVWDPSSRCSSASPSSRSARLGRARQCITGEIDIAMIQTLARRADLAELVAGSYSWNLLADGDNTHAALAELLLDRVVTCDFLADHRVRTALAPRCRFPSSPARDPWRYSCAGGPSVRWPA